MVPDTDWRRRVGMSGTRPSTASEKLHFPGEGDATGATMLGNDTREVNRGLLAGPITLPFGSHRKPGNRHRTGGNNAPHPHVMGFHRDATGGVGNNEDVVPPRRVPESPAWQGRSQSRERREQASCDRSSSRPRRLS